MTPIRLVNIEKKFGATRAVAGVSLEIAAGELFFLLGPSGCGKTTLLRMLAGFVQPDSGEVFFGNENITRLPPRSRDAGMVFQSYALWPHLSVGENVAYGLRVRGLAKAVIAERVGQILKLVRMEAYRDRKPNQLSGGQQQRVALARALVVEPRVLLLDEPLSNLDARLRDEMRDEIRRLHDSTHLTMVYVTHDQKEALTLADRVGVMNAGRLEQVGTPMEIFERPRTPFVGSFLGEANWLPGTVVSEEGAFWSVRTGLGDLVGTAPPETVLHGKKVQCMIRPHDVSLDPGGASPINRVEARIDRVAFLGQTVEWEVVAGADVRLTVLLLPKSAQGRQVGDFVSLFLEPNRVMLLPE